MWFYSAYHYIKSFPFWGSVKTSNPQVCWNIEKCRKKYFKNVYQKKLVREWKIKKEASISFLTKAVLRIMFSIFFVARVVATNYSWIFPLSHIFLWVWQPLVFRCLLIIGWSNNKPSWINISNSHANALLPRRACALIKNFIDYKLRLYCLSFKYGRKEKKTFFQVTALQKACGTHKIYL